MNDERSKSSTDHTDASAAQSSASGHDATRANVREGYARIAKARPKSSMSAGCCGPGTNCGPAAPSVDELARAVGYDVSDVAALPDGANLGLSCGNPTALAALKPGEVVLDLGSGGGMDAFLAGPRVGASGRVIGVDMTAEMLTRARTNAVAYERRTGLSNVEFRLGEIEHLPVADGSVDVVLSNCVLNLSPDKPQVWREIARVLKPGGRVAISDLALLQSLPERVANEVEALIGCIAGAALVDDIERMVKASGLVDVELRRKSGYIESLSSGDDPLLRKITAELPAGKTPADYVTSLEVVARKRAQ